MDTKKIKQIIELFEESKISSMDLEIDDIKIKLEKQPNVVEVVAPVAAPIVASPVVAVEEKKEEIVKDWLKSPLVGTYFASSKQGGKPFVEVNSKVNKGDVVCIIEAMKVMNEIKAHTSGIVSDINIKDGDMVQFDQPLIAIGE